MSYNNIIKYNGLYIDYSLNEISGLNQPIGESFFTATTNLENITVCMSGNIVSLKRNINNVIPMVFPQTSTTENSKAKTLLYIGSSSNNIRDSKIIYINGDRKDYIQTAPFNTQDPSGYKYQQSYDISLNQFKIEYSENSIDYSLNALVPLYIDNNYVIYDDKSFNRILISPDYNASTKRIFVYETYGPATRNNLSAIVINNAIYLSYIWNNRLNIKKAVFTTTQNVPYFITTPIIGGTNVVINGLLATGIVFTKMLFTDEQITFLLGNSVGSFSNIYMIYNKTVYLIVITQTTKSTSILQSNIRDCIIYRNVDIDKLNCLTLFALTNTGLVMRTFDYVALKNSIYNGNLNGSVVLNKYSDICDFIDLSQSPFILVNKNIFYNINGLKYKLDLINNNEYNIQFKTDNNNYHSQNLSITSISNINNLMTTDSDDLFKLCKLTSIYIDTNTTTYENLITNELNLNNSDPDFNFNLYEYITSNYSNISSQLTQNKFIFNNAIYVATIEGVNMNYFTYHLKNNTNVVFITILHIENENEYTYIPYVIKNFLNNKNYDGDKMKIFYNDIDDKLYISYVDVEPNNLNNKMIAQVNLIDNHRAVNTDSLGTKYKDSFFDNVEFNTATLTSIINISANKNINYYTANLVQDEYIKKLLYCNDLLTIFLTNLGRLMYLYSDNRNGSYAKLHTPSDESFTLYEIPYSYSNSSGLKIDNIYYAEDASATYNPQNKQITIKLANKLAFATIVFNDDSQPCFLSISKVLTINSNGEEEYKTIDTIKSGDIVKSLSGKNSKVKHCGYTPAFTMMDELDYPRIIPKDYFGIGLPEEQIYGSGWHAIYLPKDKSYSENVQKAIKVSKSMLSIHNEFESNTYHKVFLFTITDLCLVKSIKQIQDLTGKSTAHYYNMELDNPSEGFIISGLSVESLSKDLWTEFKFTDNQ